MGKRTRPLHPQSNPSNAGTKHLAAFALPAVSAMTRSTLSAVPALCRLWKRKGPPRGATGSLPSQRNSANEGDRVRAEVHNRPQRITIGYALPAVRYKFSLFISLTAFLIEEAPGAGRTWSLRSNTLGLAIASNTRRAS